MPGQSVKLSINEILREDMESIITREKSTFDKLIMSFNKSIVLFGAGNLGRQVLRQLREDGIEPLAFVDNNVSIHGTIIDGLSVLSPHTASERYGKSATFVVTIWNPTNSFVETQRTLIELGCTNVISVLPYRWKYSEKFLPFFWADLPSKTLEHTSDIKLSAKVWADDFSRQEYLAQLQWRIWGDFQHLACPVPQDSYFPDDLFELLPNENFVDCGAYDGITIREFLKRQGLFSGKIMAFEPDPCNYAKLEQYISNLNSDLQPNIEIYPLAVTSIRSSVHFNATGDMGASISQNGTQIVEGYTLDELFTRHNYSPTYIKMDIEGAELDALQGAANTIRVQAPILSICIYHKYDDLWRIPAYIHSLRPDYLLYMRPYEMEGWQLVCYAIPKWRIKA